MVDERDQNKTEVIQIKLEVEDFKEMWKREITHHTENPEEFNKKEFKDEEIQDEELEEDNSETEDETQDEELNEDNYESESELQTEEKPEDETQDEELNEDNYESDSELQLEKKPKGEPEDHVDAKQHNQDLRFKWYKKVFTLYQININFNMSKQMQIDAIKKLYLNGTKNVKKLD